MAAPRGARLSRRQLQFPIMALAISVAESASSSSYRPKNASQARHSTCPGLAPATIAAAHTAGSAYDRAACNARVLSEGGRGYSLSDLLRPYWSHLRPEHVLQKWPNSIAADYTRGCEAIHKHEVLHNVSLKRIVTSDYNISMLASIVERRQPERTNVTVIHLRIGDVIDRVATKVEEFLSHLTFIKNHHNAYVKPLFYYAAAPLSTSQPIVVVAGSHCGTACGHHNKSCRYLHAVVDYIRTRFAPAPVSLRLNRPADEDFAYMARATAFLPGGGGYSNLIAKLVNRSGGQVLRPPCVGA